MNARPEEKKKTTLEVLLEELSREYHDDPSKPGVVVSRVEEPTQCPSHYAAIVRFHLPGGGARDVVDSQSYPDLGLAIRTLAARWRSTARAPKSAQPLRRAQTEEEAFGVEGLRLLVDLDPDRARVRNGVGFSMADGDVGRALLEGATGEGLAEWQWTRVKQIAHKYRRQIGELRKKEDVRLRAAQIEVMKHAIRTVDRLMPGVVDARALERTIVSLGKETSCEAIVEAIVEQAVEQLRAKERSRPLATLATAEDIAEWHRLNPPSKGIDRKIDRRIQIGRVEANYESRQYLTPHHAVSVRCEKAPKNPLVFVSKSSSFALADKAEVAVSSGGEFRIANRGESAEDDVVLVFEIQA